MHIKFGATLINIGQKYAMSINANTVLVGAPVPAVHVSYLTEMQQKSHALPPYPAC